MGFLLSQMPKTEDVRDRNLSGQSGEEDDVPIGHDTSIPTLSSVADFSFRHKSAGG